MIIVAMRSTQQKMLYLKHWRGFQEHLSLKTAPILVFGH